MWPFGRRKETTDELCCASCGRTLLAGEWTQRLVTDDGDEELICSLCSQRRAPGEDAQTVTVSTAAAVPKVRSSARKSDGFWRALKEKDAEIERLEARLARVEAERQELAAELAALRGERVAEEAPVGEAEAADAAAIEPTEAASIAAFIDADVGVDDEAWPVRSQPHPGEDTAEWPAPGGADDRRRDEGATDDEGAVTDTAEFDVVVPDAEADDGRSDADNDIEYSETALQILQRGVDLLNVSPVPKKIAETSESLGIPFAHVRADGDDLLSVTFMWTMGWYRFEVGLSSAGSVRLADRGYEELADLQPNATVRSDGTVQLAPTFGKRPTPKDDGPTDTPSVASVTSGVIISKSLRGQRTDDEPIGPWEGSTPRDFDWGR